MLEAERLLKSEARSLLAARATDDGVKPRGFRAPGGERGERTAALLVQLGYRYDASLGDGMHPAVLEDGLAQVPFVWNGVDGAHYLADPPPPPADVEKSWTAALDKVVADDGLFVTVCHGFITGTDDARLAAFDRVVGRAQDLGFELLTAGQMAERVLAE